MTKKRRLAVENRQFPGDRASGSFLDPAPGTIVGAHEGGFSALTTGELTTGERYEFVVRSGARTTRLHGIVAWRRLHDLSVRGGGVRPRFEIGVLVVEAAPAPKRSPRLVRRVAA